MNINYILEKVYKADQNFLVSYFSELNKINTVYCTALYKKKYFNLSELSKISKISNFLKKNNYKVLIKKKYDRGYYFEYENFFRKKIGENISGKMHIGRSRNDLDSTIAKLILKKNLKKNLLSQSLLLEKINKKFSSNTILFPFYTQNQFSSFLSVKHYFNSNILSFVDYFKKITQNKNFINECPLGACGLNGSSINIDYNSISKKLGFTNLQSNSHRSVSEYEYYLSYINDLNLSVIKWSRILQDFQILHNENNKIIEFKKEFYGRSSFFPHKQNIFLIEYALSLSNKLCNYSSLIINGIRKCINSNSFEVKSIIQTSYKYFIEYEEFVNLISFIIQNVTFKKIDIFEKKYEHLYFTYFQNYIISKKKNLNIRKINNEIFKQIMKGLSLQEVFLKNKEYLPRSILNKDISKIKYFLLNSNCYGMGPQDKQSTNLSEIKKLLTNLKKETKKI